MTRQKDRGEDPLRVYVKWASLSWPYNAQLVNVAPGFRRSSVRSGSDDCGRVVAHSETIVGIQALRAGPASTCPQFPVRRPFKKTHSAAITRAGQHDVYSGPRGVGLGARPLHRLALDRLRTRTRSKCTHLARHALNQVPRITNHDSMLGTPPDKLKTRGSRLRRVAHES